MSRDMARLLFVRQQFEVRGQLLVELAVLPPPGHRWPARDQIVLSHDGMPVMLTSWGRYRSRTISRRSAEPVHGGLAVTLMTYSPAAG